MPRRRAAAVPDGDPPRKRPGSEQRRGAVLRSEEHTSELQSRSDLVCRLLLEKKKKYTPSLITSTKSAGNRARYTSSGGTEATPTLLCCIAPCMSSSAMHLIQGQHGDIIIVDL